MTKNSSIYFESGNNVISFPACITPRCLKEFSQTFYSLIFGLRLIFIFGLRLIFGLNGKFGPQRTIFPRSWEQVEAKSSDETHLTVVISPLCISGLIPPCLLGMPCFSLLSIMLAVPHSLPLACLSSGMKQRL